jgi:hypothetical protein
MPSDSPASPPPAMVIGFFNGARLPVSALRASGMIPSAQLFQSQASRRGGSALPQTDPPLILARRKPTTSIRLSGLRLMRSFSRPGWNV